MPRTPDTTTPGLSRRSVRILSAMMILPGFIAGLVILCMAPIFVLASHVRDCDWKAGALVALKAPIIVPMAMIENIRMLSAPTLGYSQEERH